MKKQLFDIITHLHFQSYKLCTETFGRYFDNAGNIGIFCQSNEEYESFLTIRDQICLPSNNPLLKYYNLVEPLIFAENETIPKTMYTHLYIRKPDTSDYGKNRGDIDFFVEEDIFEELKKEVENLKYKNTILSEQAGVGAMIEFSNPNVPLVAYISTKEMSERIRVRHLVS